ncbi:filamentous hemagglutinin N-terminal domain-containing protein [Babesia caballi]|uniref:Filamentous hemagglutinin N-terminal domain-containing protein n=1 Tax=Babesia caballi TaxID=5871 RepID=A0AAV4LS71_BABCB|nr:filamentous hemagglutinin N-terminal domain-containing protein [Babesia caballi]
MASSQRREVRREAVDGVVGSHARQGKPVLHRGSLQPRYVRDRAPVPRVDESQLLLSRQLPQADLTVLRSRRQHARRGGAELHLSDALRVVTQHHDGLRRVAKVPDAHGAVRLAGGDDGVVEGVEAEAVDLGLAGELDLSAARRVVVTRVEESCDVVVGHSHEQVPTRGQNRHVVEGRVLHAEPGHRGHALGALDVPLRVFHGGSARVDVPRAHSAVRRHGDDPALVHPARPVAVRLVAPGEHDLRRRLRRAPRRGRVPGVVVDEEVAEARVRHERELAPRAVGDPVHLAGVDQLGLHVQRRQRVTQHRQPVRLVVAEEAREVLARGERLAHACDRQPQLGDHGVLDVAVRRVRAQQHLVRRHAVPALVRCVRDEVDDQRRPLQPVDHQRVVQERRVPPPDVVLVVLVIRLLLRGVRVRVRPARRLCAAGAGIRRR